LFANYNNVYLSRFNPPKNKSNNLEDITIDHDIKIFSQKSRNRLLRNVNCLVRSGIENIYFATLTYQENFTDEKISKGHLNAFLTYVRKYYSVNLYIWFKEYQKRGAIHYHIVLNFNTDIDVSSLHSDCLRYWSKIVGTYGTGQHHETKGVHVVKANNQFLTRYAVKYSSKSYQKTPPKSVTAVTRFWGTSNSQVFDTLDIKCVITNHQVNRWLKTYFIKNMSYTTKSGKNVIFDFSQILWRKEFDLNKLNNIIERLYKNVSEFS